MNYKQTIINTLSNSMVLCILFLLLISIPPSHAAQDQNIEEREYEISVQSVALLHIISPNQFLYFLNDKLYSYLATTDTEPDFQYESLAAVPTDIPLVIFIQNPQVLDSLSEEDKQKLIDYYQRSYFIGVGAGAGKLKASLGVKVGSDFDSVGDDFPEDLFFIHKKPDGSVHELILHNIPANQEALLHLMLWYRNLYVPNSDSLAEAQPSGAWDANYTMDYRTKLSDGTTRLLVNGYKLKSPADKPDYYLVSTSIQTDITSHVCDSLKGHCGWFSNEMLLSAKVDSSNGGKLYEYMPTGSVGSSTQGFTIGASLTTTQAGISGSFSESYSISDASYIDNSDYITNTAKWTIKFKKPVYTWFPFIIDAPNVARNSYETHPAFIIEVPKDQCAKVSIMPYILQENDSFSYYVFVLKVKEHFSAWYSDSSPLPKTVICGN